MRKRCLSIFMVLMLVVSLLTIGTEEARAGTKLTRKEAVNWLRSLNGRSNQDCATCYDEASCTDLVTAYMNYCWLKINDDSRTPWGTYPYIIKEACSYDDEFNGHPCWEVISRTASTVPEPGDIFVSEHSSVTGYYNSGHVGIVLNPNDSGGAEIIELSPKTSAVIKTVTWGQSASYQAEHFIRFKYFTPDCTNHSYKDGICTNCGEWQPFDEAPDQMIKLFTGTYEAKENTYIRVHPYLISDSSHGEPATVLPKDARVIVDSVGVNGLNHTWYHVSYGNVSGYVYSENLEKKSSSIAKYYLGIDGLLDGKNADDIKGYGTCDVYVNGKRVANDVNDFYAEYAPGNAYEIRDIKPKADIEYKGCTGQDYYSVVVNDDQTVETCPAGVIPTNPANGSGVTLRFQFTTKNKWSSVPSGEYYFVHVATGKQLDVQSGGDYNNCNVALYGPNTSDAERWVISGSATGYKIKPKCTASRVLNSYGDSVSSGNNVNIWDSVDDNTQRWVFEEVSGGYVIRNAANKTCVLDVSDNNVFVNTYNSSSKTQIWKLVSTAQKPTITKQPTQTSVTVGRKATFSVTATGSGTLTYQWQAYNPNTAKWTNSSSASAKTATLTITTQSGHNGFKFRCIVKDGSGNTVTSNAATLTLNPKFTAQPQAASVTVGSTATFQVVAAGAAPFTYQWQAFNPATGSWVNSGSASAKTAKLSITAQTGHNGFKFRCIVTDANGTKITSSAATLTVTAALKITKQPAALTVKTGESASFSVTATGTGLTYQWQAYNPSTGTWVNSGSGSAKTSKLTITAQKGHNGFKFRCVVKDSTGKSVTSSAVTLTVTQDVELKITKQPEALTVKTGASASFSVTATGTGLTYQWQAYNPYNGTWGNSGAASAKTAKLTITTQSAHNGFKFRCVVKDSTGKTVTSSAVTLTVLK